MSQPPTTTTPENTNNSNNGFFSSLKSKFSPTNNTNNAQQQQQNEQYALQFQTMADSPTWTLTNVSNQLAESITTMTTGWKSMIPGVRSSNKAQVKGLEEEKSIVDAAIEVLGGGKGGGEEGGGVGMERLKGMDRKEKVCVVCVVSEGRGFRVVVQRVPCEEHCSTTNHGVFLHHPHPPIPATHHHHTRKHKQLEQRILLLPYVTTRDRKSVVWSRMRIRDHTRSEERRVVTYEYHT